MKVNHGYILLLKKIAIRAIILFSSFFIFIFSNAESSKALITNDEFIPLISVSGTVTGNSGQALTGVNVIVKGTNRGTITDDEGSYTIEVPDGSNVLVFSIVGYQTLEIAIGGRSVIDVQLGENVSKLTEVIVTGYGKQSRELLTTAISKLDTKVLENIPYTNVASALQGTMPGLRVQSYTGQPGTGPRIILRGGTSINNPNGSAPLYMVDGVVRPNLDDIAADDIESIQVLKDAASTAIYGARASNGVVLVTTKSGKAGTTRISYSYDLSFNDKGNVGIEYTTGRQYIEHARQSVIWVGAKVPEATTLGRLNGASGYGTGNDLTKQTAFTTMYLSPENEHKLNEGWESIQDPHDPSKTIIFKETNYQDINYQNAVSHNHYLSVAGGTDKATFNLGAGYLNGEGIALSSDYKRLTLNLNGNVKLSKKLNVSGRLMYSNASDHDISADPLTNFSRLSNTFYRSAALPSTAKYQFEDGSIAPGQASNGGNPHYYQIGPYAPKTKNVRNTLSMVIAGKWDILPGLSFDPQVAMFEIGNNYRSFQPAFLSNVRTMNTTRPASSSHSTNKTYQADAVLTYAKTLGVSHNVEVKAGYSYLDRQNFALSASGNSAATDLIPTLNASPNFTGVNGSESRFVTEGLFSRINYDFAGKYLLTLTGRYDGASNLGEAYRFGFFPGVGVGWNLHKENFWKIFPAGLFSLKLRGTYGETGNIQGLGDFQAQGLYSISSRYGGDPSIEPSVLPNPDLQWEQSRTFNAGFDLGVFNNRINVIFEVFSRLTENLLVNVNLPPSSGYGSVLTNFGSLRNKGVEMGLNARILSGSSGFHWDASLVVSTVNSEIVKLPFNGIEKNRQGGVNVWDPTVGDYVWKGGIQEGGNLNDMFAYKQIGIYATDEEAATAPLDMNVPVDQVTPANGRKKYGGDVNWADLDGNNIIDSKDQIYVGRYAPTMTGGFTNNFSYRNINLIIRTDFTRGHTIYNYARKFADGQLQGDLMPTKEFIEKSWKKQGDITDTPRYLWGDYHQNITRNNAYYEKGDFIALREVTLGYTLPASVLRKMNITAFRINLTGTNLHYFTKYKGLNPEDGGPDYGRYPNPRGINLGVNITL